jgi:integrase
MQKVSAFPREYNMARTKRGTPPSYRRHSSGQACVTVRQANGRRREILLGPWDTPESRAEYRRILAELDAGHDRLPPQGPAAAPADLSINELALAYWKHAEAYYGFDRRKGTAYNLRDALRILRELYGHTPATAFGPLALKACRAAMVKKGWSRTYTNAQVDRLRRVFRWAAEEERLPASVHNSLSKVSSLRKGNGEARETPPVRPVAPERVDATLPHMPATVAAMVCFQRLTGCRPDEACRLRPLDLDMSNPTCWVYRPGSDRGEHGAHKTAHHDHERVIFIGPRAQQVLRPFLGTKLDAFCFSPVESERRRGADRRVARQTPLTPSQHARKTKAGRKRAPGARYPVTSYRNAIYRACDRAFPLPEPLRPWKDEDGKRESRPTWWARLTAEERKAVRAWRREHRWHPHQLRHSAATVLRKEYGIEVAKIILGHSTITATQVYAERDLETARKIVAKIG